MYTENLKASKKINEVKKSDSKTFHLTVFILFPNPNIDIKSQITDPCFFFLFCIAIVLILG